MLRFAKPQNRIFHNPTLWLISLTSDWINWITIADKNLGASQVYNFGDAFSESNCWNFFQRGNCYWFPYTWPTNVDWNQVDASTYWPGNYYSSSTWINMGVNTNWDSSSNRNLRWYNTGTKEAMQWPCPSWFHIPTPEEWEEIMAIKTIIWFYDVDMLKMPLTGYLYNSPLGVSHIWEWAYARYMTSAHRGTTSQPTYDGICCKGAWIRGERNIIAIDNEQLTGTGAVIRPFKNEPEIPDSSRTVLY